MTDKHAQAMKFLERMERQFPKAKIGIMAKVIREQMAAMKGVMGYCRRVGLDEGSIFDSVHGVLEQALDSSTTQLAALEEK